jgi:hypothetical protein
MTTSQCYILRVTVTDNDVQAGVEVRYVGVIAQNGHAEGISPGVIAADPLRAGGVAYVNDLQASVSR